MPDRLWLGRTTFTACAILTVFALLWIASGYPPRARYIPEIVAIFALICLSAQLVIEIVAAFSHRSALSRSAVGRPSEAAEEPEETGTLRLELTAYFWLIVLLVGLFLFGFLVSIPVYTLLYLHFQARVSWFRAALYGSGAWVFTYVLFVRLFEIRLYYGLLFESWMDF